jgi:hypothetical protein
MKQIVFHADVRAKKLGLRWVYEDGSSVPAS